MDFRKAKHELAKVASGSDWDVRADEDGNPTPVGRLLARAAVPYHYGGSVTHTANLQPEQFAEQDETNRHLFERTMLLASREEVTRGLLEASHRRGLVYVFDPIAAVNQGAAAVLDPRSSPTHLRMHPFGLRDRYASPVSRSGTVAHEAEHDRQNQELFYNAERDTLQSGIICVRGQETAAAAMGVLGFMRDMVDLPGDPPNRLKAKGFGREIMAAHPAMQAAVKSALPDMAKGNRKAVMRKLVMAGYENERSLEFYDRMTLRFFRERLQMALKEGDPARLDNFMRTGYCDHDRVVKSLKIGGETYLDGLDVSLNAARYAGLTNSPAVRKEYEALDRELEPLRRMGYAPDIGIAQRPRARPHRASMPHHVIGRPPKAAGVVTVK